LLAAGSVALDLNDVREARKSADEAPAPIGRQQTTGDYKVNEIVAAHLMGNPARTRPVRVERAPITKLNLTLKGLLSTHDQEMARAIIAIGNKPDKLYAVGDKLESGNATVKEIQIDLVLLDRNGKVESLPLPKKLTSDSLSADALYIPVVETGTEDAAAQAATIPINTVPVRRGAQEPNFAGLESTADQVKRMAEEQEGDEEGVPEE
jgi:type II secretion system protein C